MTDTRPTEPSPTPPSPTLPAQAPRMTRRRRNTRQRLIAAAYEVFSERGIRDSPVELICERAGFTRGAFYSNFATKEELFLALFQEENDARVARLRASLADVAQRDESPRESLSQVGKAFIELYAADRTWYLLVSEFHAHALRQPDLLPQVREAQHRFHQSLAELIVLLIDQLGMRLTIPPLEAAHVLRALYEDALHRSLLAEPTTQPLSNYATQIIPQVIATLMTPAI